jgi:hypothetical protein
LINTISQQTTEQNGQGAEAENARKLPLDGNGQMMLFSGVLLPTCALTNEIAGFSKQKQ